MESARGPDTVATSTRALQVMDGAMDFADLFGTEAGFLELSIDVAGENPHALWHSFGQPEQFLKPGVRFCLPVQLEPMPIKAPGLARVAFEGGRVGDGFKSDSGASQRRINRPETTQPTKIRQAGVDAHAGAGGDQQAIGST